MSFAVMGNPIAHSLSPWIHQQFAAQCGISLVYERLLAEETTFIQQVEGFFSHGGQGLNVTLPFKERAYALAQKPTARAETARAANTLWMEHGVLHADNTDGIGLMNDLQRFITLKDKTILILGAGGAARGILQPLLDANPAQILVANRSKERLMALQSDIPNIKTVDYSVTDACDLIINATSASLTDTVPPLAPQCLANKPLCYDLAYRLKEPTPFVLWAHRLQCKAVDGLGMLVEQAAEAFYIWHHHMPDTQPVLNDLRQDKR